MILNKVKIYLLEDFFATFVFSIRSNPKYQDSLILSLKINLSPLINSNYNDFKSIRLH